MLLGIALSTALFFCAVSVLVPPHGNVKLCVGQAVPLLRDSFNYNLANFLAKDSNLSQNRRLVLADHATVGLPHGGHWVVVDQKDDGIRHGAP